MQWPEWHEGAGATALGSKLCWRCYYLLFHLGGGPYWDFLCVFVCFLRYYQAVTNQLTYDKDPDIRHTSWPNVAGTKLIHLFYQNFQILGKSTSAFHVCRDLQRCEVPLSHFCSALTAKDLKFRFPYFRSVRTSKDLVGLSHLFCQDFQVWISPLPHFISAGTFKVVKLRFRTFALPWLPKICFPYFRSGRTRKISFIFHTCSARTSKYG